MVRERNYGVLIRRRFKKIECLSDSIPRSCFSHLLNGMYSKVLDPFLQRQKEERTYKEVTDPKHVAKHSEAMAIARLAQQEKANADAMKAKEERERKERERKKAQSTEESKSEEESSGRRLGGAKRPEKKASSSTNTCGYNPMDPASGSSSGPRYR